MKHVHVKKFALMLVAAVAVIMSACTDQAEVRNIAGGYTVKTGQAIAEVITTDSTTHVALPTEQGRMSVLNKHNEGEVSLTFLLNGSDKIAANGEVHHDKLTLEPFYYTLKIQHTGALGILLSETYQVKVSGSGEVLDGHILLHLNYDGKEINAQKQLRAEDVTWICSKDK